MHGHNTTPGSLSPGVVGDDQLERILIEAAQELPPVTLAGCLIVGAEVMPKVIKDLLPSCAHASTDGSHPIPTQFIWKDLETQEAYCHLRCAALEAIERAIRIAAIEQLANTS